MVDGDEDSDLQQALAASTAEFSSQDLDLNEDEMLKAAMMQSLMHN